MNQNIFLHFFALVLVSVLFLSACSSKPINEKSESDSDVETSQGQPSEENLLHSNENSSQTNNIESNQSLSNNESGDASVSYKPGVTTDDKQKPNGSSGSSGSTEPDFLGDANENGDGAGSIQQSSSSVSGCDQIIDSKPNTDLTYQEYMSMTPTEQKAHYDTFDDVMDFIAWLNAAKEKYNAENDSVEMDGGSIDLGEIMDKNS